MNRQRLKQWFCSHLYDIADLPKTAYRDTDNKLHWPCCKCGKEFIGDYGLQVPGDKIINSDQDVAE